MLEAFLIILLNLRLEDFVTKEFICCVSGLLYYRYFLKTKLNLYVISKVMNAIYNSSETPERVKMAFLSLLGKALEVQKFLGSVFISYITCGLNSIKAILKPAGK